MELTPITARTLNLYIREMRDITGTMWAFSIGNPEVPALVFETYEQARDHAHRVATGYEGTAGTILRERRHDLAGWTKSFDNT